MPHQMIRTGSMVNQSVVPNLNPMTAPVPQNFNTMQQQMPGQTQPIPQTAQVQPERAVAPQQQFGGPGAPANAHNPGNLHINTSSNAGPRFNVGNLTLPQYNM